MIARVLITTYLLLVPPKTLKWTYLVYAVIQAMGYWLISLGHFFPDLSLLLYYSGMFIFGAGRGIYSFPYLILCRTFNQSSDFSALNVWIAISMGGNLWGFYLETFFLDNLQWPWPLGISVFSFIYFFLSLITYAVVEEAEI